MRIVGFPMWRLIYNMFMLLWAPSKIGYSQICHPRKIKKIHSTTYMYFTFLLTYLFVILLVSTWVYRVVLLLNAPDPDHVLFKLTKHTLLIIPYNYLSNFIFFCLHVFRFNFPDNKYSVTSERSRLFLDIDQAPRL